MTTLTAAQKRRLTSLFGLLAIVAIGGALALNHSANADSNLLLQAPGIQNATGFADVGQLIDKIPVYLYEFAGAAALLAFFAGAYTYFLSGGNEETINKGRTQMIGSIVAFALIVVGALFVKMASDFFQRGKL